MDGFVVLAGDMVFKDLLVGMNLLLGHERLSVAACRQPATSADLPASKTKVQRQSSRGLAHRSQTAVVPFRSFPDHTAKATHRQCGELSKCLTFQMLGTFQVSATSFTERTQIPRRPILT
jgi:hypothetical protein